MAEKLRDVIIYFCKHYPYKDRLSKSRLTKMVYLADWESAYRYGHQITNIKWMFNHYGPYVDDVINAAITDPHLEVVSQRNTFGDVKEVIRLVRNRVSFNFLNPEDFEILNFIIDETKYMYWNEFIHHVYSTYPIKENMRYSYLDLVKLGEEYHPVN